MAGGVTDPKRAKAGGRWQHRAVVSLQRLSPLSSLLRRRLPPPSSRLSSTDLSRLREVPARGRSLLSPRSFSISLSPALLENVARIPRQACPPPSSFRRPQAVEQAGLHPHRCIRPRPRGDYHRGATHSEYHEPATRSVVFQCLTISLAGKCSMYGAGDSIRIFGFSTPLCYP